MRTTRPTRPILCPLSMRPVRGPTGHFNFARNRTFQLCCDTACRAHVDERPESGGKEQQYWETGDQKRPPRVAAAWTEPRSSKRAVGPFSQDAAASQGRSTLIRWVEGHAYLYERTYLGVLRTGRPRYRDSYLGRVNDGDARRWRSDSGSPPPQLVRAWTEPRSGRPKEALAGAWRNRPASPGRAATGEGDPTERRSPGRHARLPRLLGSSLPVRKIAPTSSDETRNGRASFITRSEALGVNVIDWLL
jgi:hypothetical protein